MPSPLNSLIRRGIVLDYVGHEDPLPFVRGRVKTSTTALNYYQGRLEIDCEYEDFGEDTPLNRILQAAGKLVSSRQVGDCLQRFGSECARD